MIEPDKHVLDAQSARLLLDAKKALRRGEVDVTYEKLREFLQCMWVPGNAMAGTTIKVVVDPLVLGFLWSLIDMLNPKGKVGGYKLVSKPRRGRGKPRNPAVEQRNQHLAVNIKKERTDAPKKQFKDLDDAAATRLKLKCGTVAKARQRAHREEARRQDIMASNDNPNAMARGQAMRAPAEAKSRRGPAKKRKKAFNSTNMVLSLNRDRRGKP